MSIFVKMPCTCSSVAIMTTLCLLKMPISVSSGALGRTTGTLVSMMASIVSSGAWTAWLVSRMWLSKSISETTPRRRPSFPQHRQLRHIVLLHQRYHIGHQISGLGGDNLIGTVCLPECLHGRKSTQVCSKKPFSRSHSSSNALLK